MTYNYAPQPPVIPGPPDASKRSSRLIKWKVFARFSSINQQLNAPFINYFGAQLTRSLFFIIKTLRSMAMQTPLKKWDFPCTWIEFSFWRAWGFIKTLSHSAAKSFLPYLRPINYHYRYRTFNPDPVLASSTHRRFFPKGCQAVTQPLQINVATPDNLNI